MKNTMILISAVIILSSIVYFFIKEPDVDPSYSPGSQMSFFVTSKNPGQGGDLGGLTGADNYCKSLAESVGVYGKTWKAYLSGQGQNGVENARDRIGQGPWYNYNGFLIASNLQELHEENSLKNNINKQTALSENGQTISGRGDKVNMHDILTGSDSSGNAIATSSDTTCNNWTSSTTGSAILGHHDRVGINETTPMKSWNSSHSSRGCSLEALKQTGGGGLFYCFAAN